MNNTATERSPLYNFWQRSQTGNSNGSAADWNKEVQQISSYGRGTEEALKFLYTKRPSFELFMEWLSELSPPLQTELIKEDILTAEQLHSWNKNGYIRVPGVIPAEQCKATCNAIWEYIEADPAWPDSWYTPHEGKNGLMLSLFHHATLDSNRTSARIQKIYTELYGHSDIYLLIDKTSFNPPENRSHKFNGSSLHWDTSLHLPIPDILQGLLYLNDVDENDGAFHCVPGFHKEINTWLPALPAGTDPRKAALDQLKPVAVAGKAGDLIVWHQALPHCATPNKGTMPRMVQYIAYKPVHIADQEIWE